LENSSFIWSNYATDNERGKVCLVLAFEKLRSRINNTLRADDVVIEFEGSRCHQIFSVNYGLVEYVDWHAHQTNSQHLANPISYTYLKDKQLFSEEHEFRIALSAIGIGQFALRDKIMSFPPSLQLSFNFHDAIADGTITAILHAPDADREFLRTELQKLNIALFE
jgi:hypothetical protein